MYHHLTDRELLACEEERAFRLLYDRYWEDLYRKAVVRLGNDADAQDAVQEVFISCWRNRHGIQVAETLAPYLFTALRMCIIRRVVRQAKKGQILPLDITDLAGLQPDAEDQLRCKELVALIQDEVSVMPPRMQQVFRMSRMENHNTAHIARELQLSEQTIKNTLSSALKRLRRRLSHFSLLLAVFF